MITTQHLCFSATDKSTFGSICGMFTIYGAIVSLANGKLLNIRFFIVNTIAVTCMRKIVQTVDLGNKFQAHWNRARVLFFYNYRSLDYCEILIYSVNYHIYFIMLCLVTYLIRDVIEDSLLLIIVAKQVKVHWYMNFLGTLSLFDNISF